MNIKISKQMLLKIFKRKISKRKTFFNLSVIVDFIFENGLIFIVIRNLSDEPAFKVTIKFEPPIAGVDGRNDISLTPLFKNIEFLAPRKEIKAFLNSSQSYFTQQTSRKDQIGRPEQVVVEVSYINAYGENISGTIKHDLSIYKEFGYIKIADS